MYDARAKAQRIFVNSSLVASRSAQPLTCRGEVEAGRWNGAPESLFRGYFSAGEVVGAAFGAEDLSLLQASSEESAKAGKPSAEVTKKKRLAKANAAHVILFPPHRLITVSPQYFVSVCSCFLDTPCEKRAQVANNIVLPDAQANSAGLIVRELAGYGRCVNGCIWSGNFHH